MSASADTPKYVEPFQRALDGVTAIEPLFATTIETHEFPAFFATRSAPKSSFEYLVRSVVSQQISGAASSKIMARFLALGTGSFPEPAFVAGISLDDLRAIGFSQRKAEYTTGLAQLYVEGKLSDEVFAQASNEDVVARIVAVRGLGPWTAEMFLIFYLHRMDVFSPSDLGVQRGMKRYMEMRQDKLRLAVGKTKKDYSHMHEIASRFKPFRTALQMVLWKLSDIQMNTVEARNSEQGTQRSSETAPGASASTDPSAAALPVNKEVQMATKVLSDVLEDTTAAVSQNALRKQAKRTKQDMEVQSAETDILRPKRARRLRSTAQRLS